MLSKSLTNALISPSPLCLPKPTCPIFPSSVCSIKPRCPNCSLMVRANFGRSSISMRSNPKKLRPSKPFKLHAVSKLSSNFEECNNAEDGEDVVILEFSLLGGISTREGRFSSGKVSAKLPMPDPMKPYDLALTIAHMGVEYVVLRSVDRDDLPDGGSGHIAQTVKAIKELKPETWVECVSPDFQGDLQAVYSLAHSGLDVFAHSIETVKRLQSKIRGPLEGYDQSLSVLKHAKVCDKEVITKSSIMLGCGELDEEVKEAIDDLRAIGVDILTLGQSSVPATWYLQKNWFIDTSKFAFWKNYAESIGFRYVASGLPIFPPSKEVRFYAESLVRGKAT